MAYSSGLTQGAKDLYRSAGGTIKSYLGTSVHRTGARWAREAYGMGKGLGKLGRGLGLAYLGYQAISGFQEGGTMGALGNVARGAAESYIYGAGFKALGISASVTLGASAGLGLIGGGLLSFESARQGVSPMQMMARPAVHEYMRKRAKLEMGSPVYDPYGTAATMRKRGLMAMRQSKITARSALGTEGGYRYKPYLR